MINHKIEEKFVILKDCMQRLESKYNNNIDWIRAYFGYYEKNKRVFLKEAKLNGENIESNENSGHNNNKTAKKKQSNKTTKKKKKANKQKKRKYREKRKVFDEVQDLLDNIRDMDSDPNTGNSMESSCFISSNDEIVIKPIGNDQNEENSATDQEDIDIQTNVRILKRNGETIDSNDSDLNDSNSNDPNNAIVTRSGKYYNKEIFSI